VSDRRDYPSTRIEDAVAEVAGVRFPDPYRWLQDDASSEVRLWQESQNALASSHVEHWPGLQSLRQLVERHRDDASGAIPRFAGGLWFRKDGLRVIVEPKPFGEGRVLLDLNSFRIDNAHPFLSWLSPSPDGKVLAIGVCTDGSENNTIRLIDVETGEERWQPPTPVLHDSWSGGAAWLPDSSGFYFCALASSTPEFEQKVFFHQLCGETRVEEIPGLSGDRDYSAIQISRDGRWAVCAHRLLNPIPLALRDLANPDAGWRPFVTDIPGIVAGHIVGDRYVALTDLDAPRGRLVAVPLDAKEPNDTSRWVELVPASQRVLRTVIPVADHLYVVEIDNTYSKVTIVDLEGCEVGTLPLPASGAVFEEYFPLMMLLPRGHPDEFVFMFSTLTSSWAAYRYRLGAAELDMLKPPAVTLHAVVDDCSATSHDGTEIPYHVVRPLAVADATPSPTLLHAYGGYDSPLLPGYPPLAIAAFVAAGGTFVHAHIRGGGEFGKEWWEGGRMENKLNCTADLFAVAEDLIAKEITTAAQLGFVGGSNGGLLAGNAITMRPDLWKAVVSLAPWLDLISFCDEPYGRWGCELEYGDPDDPDEVRRLSTFSPYHLVKRGTQYPAVLIEAGETDRRCPAWHARKFAARLQAAQAGDAPILVHVWENAGHGDATEMSLALDQDTEWLAFIMKNLNLVPES
jgi:prolyl oligopeptidase